jgi:hypothetical protein
VWVLGEEIAFGTHVGTTFENTVVGVTCGAAKESCLANSPAKGPGTRRNDYVEVLRFAQVPSVEEPK